MDESSVAVHFDLPRDRLIYNVAQQFAGWIASREPLDVAALRFRVDGEDVEFGVMHRADVEQALSGHHVICWHFLVDRRFTLARSARLLTIEIVVGERVLHTRSFCKGRSLLPEKDNGPLYFMHIPKTAGTALRHLVDYVFAASPSLLVYGDPHGVGVDDFQVLPRHFLSSREIVFGHFDFSLTRLDGNANPKIVTALRQPSELIRSYLAFNAEPAAQFLDNPLVRHLSGVGYCAPFGQITQEHLEIAIQHARKHCFIVRQENLQRFADELVALFGLPSYAVERVNETGAPRQTAAGPLPVDLRYDTLLYDAACSTKQRSFAEFLNA